MLLRLWVWLFLMCCCLDDARCCPQEHLPWGSVQSGRARKLRRVVLAVVMVVLLLVMASADEARVLLLRLLLKTLLQLLLTLWCW